MSYEKAMQHLSTHKNLCLELARHHGVSDHYTRNLLKGGTGGDIDTAGEWD